jgi:Fe2+ or Zn2+ uptake regulation protein
MNEEKRLIAELKKNGCRITKLRQAMIGLFCQVSHPQSAGALMMALLKKGISVNKTSVYRELQFLTENQVIKSVTLSDQESLYELVGDHHHHIVCRDCKVVEDVRVDGIEDALHVLEKGIARKSNFSDLNHSLEFFGQCSRCR